MSETPKKSNIIIYVVVLIVIILLYFGYTKYIENKEKEDIIECKKNDNKEVNIESYDLEQEVANLSNKQSKILEKLTNDVGI